MVGSLKSEHTLTTCCSRDTTSAGVGGAGYRDGSTRTKTVGMTPRTNDWSLCRLTTMPFLTLAAG
jgi:hypothetical protein